MSKKNTSVKKKDKNISQKDKNISQKDKDISKSKKKIAKPDEITPTRRWYIDTFKKKYLDFDMNQKLLDYFESGKHDSDLLYGAYNRINTY